MRLVSYDAAGAWRAGVLVDGVVHDAGVDSVREILEGATPQVGEPVGDVRLGPPVPDPDKILCIGLNYRAHTDEVAFEAPPEPTVFAKFRNSLIGHEAPIVVPGVAAEQVDYEAELAVVIGRRTRRVSAAQALDALAGAMPFHDVSARDLQFRTTQWTAGKAIDTFAPCGPALVTMDEIGDLGDLRVMARVNGELVQDQSTAEMIFGVAEIVAYLSSFMTLEPGDIIATGTPSGVGFTRSPPLLLGHGDEVEIEVEGLGVLRNRVEREAAG
jgi:2-keto-4-pentenoate hydratase/2-oxohepta-3-ene-1,7-dioic acid hydratase in catechol pathway